LQQSFNSSISPFALAVWQETFALHELIKSTPLNLAPKHEAKPLHDKSTLPISALEHEKIPSESVHDGPTTLPMVAPKHDSAPVHEPSRQTTKEQWKTEEEEQ